MADIELELGEEFAAARPRWAVHETNGLLDEWRGADAATLAERSGEKADLAHGIQATADFPAFIDLASLDGANGFRIDGIDAGDYSGNSVASVGDVNGDGFDDLIIGADYADSTFLDDNGQAYVLFGSEAGFAARVGIADLDGSNGFRLEGADALDYLGTSVASAGDVNGDGLDDIIASAPAPGAGESYVVFGSDERFAASIDVATLDGVNGFRIDGIDPDDYAGGSVASAGDINGDGFDDVILGALVADGKTGESYVVFGSSAPFAARIALEDLDGSNGFLIGGARAAGQSGQSVAGTGDVNGDGIDDIIIGAPFADPGGQPFLGQSYVVFGSRAGYEARFNLAGLDGTNGFSIDGANERDLSGYSVASAGDVNGDGLDDILIGARSADPDGNDSAGESYVVFGSGAGFAANISLAELDGVNGFSIEGVSVRDLSGISVASAGDVNGDGFDDVVIGAFAGDPGGEINAGESYVIFGKADGFSASLDLAELNGINGFRLDGIDAYDYSGESVAAAGDVNGDGFDDIIIGARSADPGRNDGAGESYVVFGRAPTTAVERIGAAGGQVIHGGAFDDTLSGLGGDDTLGGGDGADELAGGTGDDNYFVNNPGDVVIDLAGEGYDKVRSSVNFDAAGLNVEAIIAKSGQGLALSAGDDATRLRGNTGDDTLTGGEGQDTIKGGDGDDRLVVTAGSDLLKGEAGADAFILTDDFANADRATIRDFASGIDRLEIDADDFGGGLVAGPLDPDAFAANANGRARDAEDRFLYDIDSGKLFYDADGTGAGEKLLIARLSGAPTMEAGDFEIVDGGRATQTPLAIAAETGSFMSGGAFAEMKGFDLLIV